MIEYGKTPEGIDFYDRHRLTRSRVARLKRGRQMKPSVMIEYGKTPEGIDFYDRDRLAQPRFPRLKRRHAAEPSLIMGWLLLLNLLAFFLMSEMAKYIFIK
jgi:hypothetical protein